MTHQFTPVEIDQVSYSHQFAICTLVTDHAEYQGMLDSFARAGFSPQNSQFIFADNSTHNKLDAYQAVKKFINHADAEYIIICHQDILLDFDDKAVLEQRIAALDAIDPNWGICGNAGYINFKNYAMRISDPHEENINVGPFPAKVKSLDENFLVLRKHAALSVSSDLSGFHLYATDMCILADILGHNSYVIDFHLRHNSGGNIEQSFEQSKRALLNKYANALSNKYIRSTCTKMIITSNRALNRIFNRNLFYSIRKRIEIITNLFRN